MAAAVARRSSPPSIGHPISRNSSPMDNKKNNNTNNVVKQEGEFARYSLSHLPTRFRPSKSMHVIYPFPPPIDPLGYSPNYHRPSLSSSSRIILKIVTPHRRPSPTCTFHHQCRRSPAWRENNGCSRSHVGLQYLTCIVFFGAVFTEWLI